MKFKDNVLVLFFFVESEINVFFFFSLNKD